MESTIALLAVEIVPGNYSDIRLVDDRIFYLRRTVADDQAGEDEEDQDGADRKGHLCFYSLEDRKETVLGEVNGYRDNRRRQEDAGQDQKGLRHHRPAQGQDSRPRTTS